MVKMKYFFCDATGVNADIERHRKHEQELIDKIEELESSTDEFDQTVLRSYRNFLTALLISKANVVEKLGRK